MQPTELRLPTRDGVNLRALHWSDPVAASGTPIVLIHGLASNCRLWDGAARELAGMGHGVIALDLRGHGRSDKPETGYGVGEVAQDVIDIIRLVGQDNAPWARPLVIGQSWGGNVVIEIAARHSSDVRGVVAVDGGTIDLSRAFREWHECERALAPPKLAGMQADRLRSFIRGAHPDWSDEAIDGQMANMEHRPDGTIAPWLTFERHMKVLRGMWEHHPVDLFPTIEVPVLFTPAVKIDDEMARTKRASHATALETIPQCKVEWFEPADHDLHAQHPARFASVVNDCIVGGFFR